MGIRAERSTFVSNPTVDDFRSDVGMTQFYPATMNLVPNRYIIVIYEIVDARLVEYCWYDTQQSLVLKKICPLIRRSAWCELGTIWRPAGINLVSRRHDQCFA